MSWIEDQLEARQKALKAIYSPTTSFGNHEIVTLLQGIEEDQRYLENHEKCSWCDGEGGKEHICDCDLCTTQTEDCDHCGGEGYIEKKGQ